MAKRKNLGYKINYPPPQSWGSAHNTRSRKASIRRSPADTEYLRKRVKAGLPILPDKDDDLETLRVVRHKPLKPTGKKVY